LGSTHCLGMCGAIVVLFEEQAADGSRLLRRFLYNAGRLGFYAVLGGIGAAGISLLAKSAGADAALLVLRILAGLLVIALGLNLLFDVGVLQFVERGGARLWRFLSPLARHVLPVSTPARALAAGFIWGALPCGLVYSAVAMAATTGNVAGGMLVMLVFWLGTMPALLFAGASAAKIAAWRRQRRVRHVAGALLIAIGLFALAAPLQRLAGKSHDAHASLHAVEFPLQMTVRQGADRNSPCW
ncbi:MAG: sulfite exporter TauE/SafE family protein, partial [Woeseiaceae bacterium]